MTAAKNPPTSPGPLPGTGPAASGNTQPPSALGPDWALGTDGIYFRRAARVLLFDAAGRVLVARGHDLDQPQRSWWFTVGGGIGAGESDRDAAVRELFEETGIRIDPGALLGPVLTRTAIFDFALMDCRQDEVFFRADLGGQGHEVRLRRDLWTAVEQETVDEMAWCTAQELRAMKIEVFPKELPDIVAELRDGWNGITRHVGLQPQ